MRTYRYTADELSKSIIIPLGYTDESHATKLCLDAAVWLDDCPGGALHLLVRNPNGDLYAAPTTREDDVLVWELTGGDTAYSGAGEIELNLRGTNGECIKSARCSTWIEASLNGEAGSPPEEVQDWITNLLNAAAEASGAAGMIDNMTVEANAMPAGSAAYAELTEVSGHYHLKLGLPRGDTGETGATGATGATGEPGPEGPQGPIGETPRISVKVATGAAGSEAQVTVGGTAEAPIIYLTIPRGDPGRDGTGAGTVTAVKVAGETHAPDDTGVVDLGQITGGADLSDAAPAALGTAAAGTSELAARADHVHPMPTAAQVGAASAESVSQLKDDISDLQENQEMLKNDLADAWTSGKTYAVGDYCISGNQLYKCLVANTGMIPVDGSSEWAKCTVAGELKYITDANRNVEIVSPDIALNVGDTFTMGNISPGVLSVRIEGAVKYGLICYGKQYYGSWVDINGGYMYSCRIDYVSDDVYKISISKRCSLSGTNSADIAIKGINSVI